MKAKRRLRWMKWKWEEFGDPYRYADAVSWDSSANWRTVGHRTLANSNNPPHIVTLGDDIIEVVGLDLREVTDFRVMFSKFVEERRRKEERKQQREWMYEI